jgi:hypothetical protein
MKKFLIILLFGFVSIYAIAWVASISIYANFSKSLVNTDGQIATIDGFPLFPRLTFSGTYQFKDGTIIQTPALHISGFPFPAQRLNISTVQGLSIRASYWVTDIPIDQLDIKFQIPLRMPHTNLKSDWVSWQQTNDIITIDTLRLQSKEFVLNGTDGLLQINQNLEWDGAITTRLIGTDQFVMSLSEQGMIPPKAALTAQSFLQFLTRTDEVTGERFIQTSLQMRNNTLYIGPVRVASIPPLTLK